MSCGRTAWKHARNQQNTGLPLDNRTKTPFQQNGNGPGKRIPPSELLEIVFLVEHHSDLQWWNYWVQQRAGFLSYEYRLLTKDPAGKSGTDVGWKKGRGGRGLESGGMLCKCSQSLSFYSLVHVLVLFQCFYPGPLSKALKRELRAYSELSTLVFLKVCAVDQFLDNMYNLRLLSCISAHPLLLLNL